MSDIQAVVTDIGRVVLAVEEDRTDRALSERTGVPAEDIRQRRHNVPDRYVNLYCGHWSVADLYDAHFRELLPQVGPDGFRKCWDLMVCEDFPEVRRAYEALPANVGLYALTNTCDSHVEILRGHWLWNRATAFWCSNEIALAKPDPAIFAFVIEQVPCEPGEILFFDDVQENCDAAREAGMEAVLVTEPSDVTDALGEKGLLVKQPGK